uniref:Uncharacterized protein n=1 Tax=uncultured prokaryote TaxID=198431 RepID=A0A0H5PZ29_9ZZZZ|nr:hypothetical protein [uncultured prokaryote]
MMVVEADLSCPWWDLCDNRACWRCVQACAERRAAAREAALERMFDAAAEGRALRLEGADLCALVALDVETGGGVRVDLLGKDAEDGEAPASG